MSLPPKILDEETFVVFDKPAGVAVSADGLMKEIHEKLGRNVINAHRLEEEASGTLLCAKTKVALDYLTGQFQSKTVLRRYLALVAVRDERGSLPVDFAVDLFIGPDEAAPGQIRPYRKKEKGKESRTEFTVREVFRGYALVECRPSSGQAHQIRLHLAQSQAPIVGDLLYAAPPPLLLLSSLKRGYKGRDEEKPLIGRLALHASELTFRHPETKLPVTVAAPLPHEFEIALKYLRKFGQGFSKR